MANQGLLPLVLAQAWQLAALVVAVMFLSRLAARNRPHLAHALWLVVLVKCVTPPVWGSPLGVFSWITTATGAAHGGANASAARVDARTADRNWHDARAADSATIEAHQIGVSHGVKETPAEGILRADAPSTTAASVVSRARLKAFAIAAWLTGIVAVTAVAVIRSLCCWWRLRTSHDERREPLERLVRRMSRRLGLRRQVRLRITTGRVGPAVIGLARPTILLPACVVRDKSAADLEPLLAHELIHVRRGDLWLSLLQVIAQAVWWFHPLVWLAGRMIAREAERCCDEEVIGELGCEPARYARGLLDVLALKRTLVAVPALPGVRAVDITSKRLERIMTLGQGCHRRTPWWCWLAMGLIAVMALPGSPLAVTGSEAPEEESDAAVAEASEIEVEDGGDASQAATPAEASAVRHPAELQKWISGFRYEVGDLLDAVEESFDIDRPKARDALREMLIARCRQPIDATGNQQAVAAPEPDPAVHWKGDSIVLCHSGLRHQRAEHALREMRRFGFEQVQIEIRFLSVPAAFTDKLSNRWTTLPGGSSRSDGAAGPHGAESQDTRPAANANASGYASFAVEKNLPVVLDVLDEERARKVLDVAQRDRRANVLQAPRVRTTNGQSATVLDTTQTPFVVGIQDGQPQIRIVTEGTVVRARPILRDDKVRLDFEILMSSIGNVEEVNVRTDRDAKPVKVQVPEVARSQIASSIELPLGQTLLVGGLKNVNAKEDNTSIAVTLRATKVPAQERVYPLRRHDAVEAGGALGPAPAFAAPDAARDATSKRDKKRRLGGDRDLPYTVTYAAFDLVAVRRSTEAAGDATPNFAPLVKLITSTVRPDSWTETGGSCTVRPFPKNLSLVITQTGEGHKQIDVLFEQLRSQQNVRVETFEGRDRAPD
ncbi:MAG: hypothetical protein HYX69_04370 [Planctomycetia bacterium]|nr:hypothetical protein [Planctomycetia bacterium]